MCVWMTTHNNMTSYMTKTNKTVQQGTWTAKGLPSYSLLRGRVNHARVFSIMVKSTSLATTYGGCNVSPAIVWRLELGVPIVEGSRFARIGRGQLLCPLYGDSLAFPMVLYGRFHCIHQNKHDTQE